MRSPIITICIACTARSMARRPRNVPAHPYLLLPRLVVTPGGSIAAVCSKHQLPPDRQFATHRLDQKFAPNRPTLCLATRERLSAANCFDNYANTHELMGYRASLTLR